MGSSKKYALWLSVLVVLYVLFKKLHIQNWVVYAGARFMQSATLASWVIFTAITLLIVGTSALLLVKWIEGMR